MINTNASLDALSRIPFGASLNGQHKSLKIKYSRLKAERFIAAIPARYRIDILRYVAKKTGNVLIAMTAPANNNEFWAKVRDAQDAATLVIEPKQLTLKGM